MRSQSLLVAVVATATFGAGVALASDTKNYGGAHCRATKQNRVVYEFAQAYNKSTTQTLGVECPAVQDARGTEQVAVRVLSRNGVALVEGAPGVVCSFWTWNGESLIDGGFQAFFESKRVPEANRTQVQTLTFAAQPNFAVAPYKNVFCLLPPASDGRSGVVQYSIREAD